MMNRLINAVITDASTTVSADFADPGNIKHKARFEALFEQAKPDRTPIDPSLTNSRGPITVSEDQMSRLDQAEKIAMVTKMLLTPGNQKKIIGNTGGLSTLRTSYTKSYYNNFNSVKVASASITVGGGNCGEHAIVAFEIAKSLNLPVARYSDRNIDHAYVALFPNVPEPIIIDAWTDFPTVCQKTEYKLSDPCHEEKLQEEYVPNSTTNGNINLEFVMLTKEKVASQLGADGIDDALKEDARMKYSISSKMLDRLMLSQGVTSYNAIDIKNLNENEKSEVRRKQNKINVQLEKSIKKDMERSSVQYGDTGIDIKNEVLKARGGANPADFETAFLAAKEEADKKAQATALEQAFNRAIASAQKRQIPKCSKTISASHAFTKIVNEATVSIKSTVTATVSVKPAVWNTQINATTYAYKIDGGNVREFNRAPFGHYDNLISAKENKFPRFSKIDEFKAKIGIPHGILKQLKKELAQIINNNLKRTPPPTQLELQNRVDQQMYAITQQLPSHQLQSQYNHSDETQTLSEIQKRIYAVSHLTLDQTLLSLSASLPRLADENIEQGAQILRQWLDTTYATENYTRVINQLVTGWKSSFCDDQAAGKEKAILSVLERKLTPYRLALETTDLLYKPDSHTRNKAARFFFYQLLKINFQDDYDNALQAFDNHLQGLSRPNIEKIYHAINAIPQSITTSNVLANTAFSDLNHTLLNHLL